MRYGHQGYYSVRTRARGSCPAVLSMPEIRPVALWRRVDLSAALSQLLIVIVLLSHEMFELVVTARNCGGVQHF